MFLKKSYKIYLFLAGVFFSATVFCNQSLAASIEDLEQISSEDPAQAVILGESLLTNLNEKAPDFERNKADILNHLSHAYLLSGDYTLATVKAQEAKLTSESVKYALGQGLAFKNIAHIYLLLGNYELALENYFKALDFRRQSGSQLEIARALINIGQVYTRLHQNDDAIGVYSESLTILNSIDSRKYKAYAFGGISYAYLDKKRYEVAFDYANRAINLLTPIDDKTGLSVTYDLLGQIKQAQGNIQSAEDFYLQSLSIASDNRLVAVSIQPVLNLARLNMAKENHVEAYRFAIQALDMTNARQDLVLKSESLSLLSNIEENRGNYQAALGFIKMHQETKDEIFNTNSDRNIAVLRAEYEVDNLNRQNQLLKQQNELNQANIAQQKSEFKLLISIFIIIITTLSFLYYLFSYKKSLKQERLINEQLTELNEMKDQILTNTSHEFRTPLSGIIGLADCLYEELSGPQTKEAKENLQIIVSSGRRLTSLVDDIIDFAQLKSGNFRLQLQTIDLSEIASEVVKTCMPLLSGKSVSIENTIPAKTYFVSADEKRLTQVLFNLIGNAIKYSHKGQITISARKKSKKILVIITDEGIGIPEDKRDIIFEYFEQLDATASRKAQGAGLGLAIAKRLVQLHGGDIIVESEEGKGSSFIFDLNEASKREKQKTLKSTH